MDGLVVEGRSGMTRKPSNAIGMLITPSRINNPLKKKISPEHKQRTTRITFPPREANTAVEAVINALPIANVGSHHFVWLGLVFSTYRLQERTDHGSHSTSSLSEYDSCRKISETDTARTWNMEDLFANSSSLYQLPIMYCNDH
jgi:hypothetical protein